jgi:hypothetical protein
MMLSMPLIHTLDAIDQGSARAPWEEAFALHVGRVLQPASISTWANGLIHDVFHASDSYIGHNRSGIGREHLEKKHLH